MTAAKDLGPLDWKVPIVDKQGRPSPEFQRRWNTQRNNNALIGTLTLGSGAPSGTPDDGAEYVDIGATPFTLYVGNAGSWHKAGITKFLELVDVPGSYASAATKIVRVNAGATGLEFVTQSAELDTVTNTANNLLLRGVSGWAGATVSQVLDVIGSTRGAIVYRSASGWALLGPGTSGNVLQTNGAGADPTWVAPSGGGVSNTIPDPTTFTWVNQHSSTATQLATNGSVLVVLDSSNNGWKGLFTNVPGAAPYKVKAQVYGLLSGNPSIYGIYFSDGTKLYGVEYLVASNAIRVEKITNPTTDNSTVVGIGVNAIPTWFQMRNDGAKLYFDISYDPAGTNFNNLWSENVGTWLTPTQYGYGGLAQGGTISRAWWINFIATGNANLN